VLDWSDAGDADDFAVSGVLADGSRTMASNWETTDADPITSYTATFAAAMRGADVPFYVSFSTIGHGSGEIRGQLVCIATDNSETVDGTSANDVLPGLGGDDVLNGGAGNDSLDGGVGSDAMYGGSGNDTYYVDGNDGVIENANEGTDTVYSTVHYTLTDNVENLVLQGGADLQGYGNTLTNTITGNTGNNLLDGKAGSDIMIGGGGDDVYFVDDINDTVIENAGEGADAVFSTVHYTLSANVDSLVLQGSADLQGYGNDSANQLHGNSGNNLLSGLGGDDVMDGGAGSDTMLGGAGNDAYYVGSGDSVVENANEGNDGVYSTIHYALTANVENLVLLGSDDLQGYGNALANTIIGNTGKNLLDGGAGATPCSAELATTFTSSIMAATW
jgi:Ca2+-binding RTX toxin-like protein